MATRFFAEYKDFNDILHRVNIIDVDFTGTATEITMAAGGVERSFDTMQELLFTQMMPCRIIAPVIVSPADTALQSFIDSVPTIKENKVFIEYRRGSSRVFIGKLLVDMFDYDDSQTYTYNFTGTDGLKTLENFDFNYINTITDTHIVDIDVIIQALKPITTDQFYSTGSTAFISSAITWLDRRIGTALIPDGTLANIRTSKQIFYSDIENKQPVTCKKALEIVLQKYGACIRMEGGRWVVTQFGMHLNTTPTFWNYDKDGTYFLQTTPNLDITMGASDNKPRAVVINSYKPMLRRVQLSSKGTSIWSDGNMNSTTPAPDLRRTYNSTVRFNNIPLSIRGIITTVLNTPAGFDFGRTVNYVYRMFFIFKAGRYYLQGSNRTNTGYSWTLTQSEALIFMPSNNTKQDRTGFNIVVPPPPDAILSPVEWEIVAIDYGIPSSANASGISSLFPIFNAQFWAQIDVGARIGFQDNQNTLEVGYRTQVTDFAESSYDILKSDYMFEQTSDVPFVMQWPEYKVSATDWDLTGEWVDGNISDPPSLLGLLITESAMEFQRQPRMLIQGRFRFNVFQSIFTMLWRGKRWAFLGGTQNSQTCEWDGTWIEVSTTTGGTSSNVSTPIRDATDRLKSQVDGLRDGMGANNGQINNLQGELNELKEQVNQLVLAQNNGIDGWLINNVDGMPLTDQTVTLKCIDDNGERVLVWQA